MFHPSSFRFGSFLYLKSSQKMVLIEIKIKGPEYEFESSITIEIRFYRLYISIIMTFVRVA